MTPGIIITAFLGFLGINLATFKFLNNKIENKLNNQVENKLNNQQTIMIVLARIEDKIIAIEKQMACLEDLSTIFQTSHCKTTPGDCIF